MYIYIHTYIYVYMLYWLQHDRDARELKRWNASHIASWLAAEGPGVQEELHKASKAATANGTSDASNEMWARRNSLPSCNNELSSLTATLTFVSASLCGSYKLQLQEMFVQYDSVPTERSCHCEEYEHSPAPQRLRCEDHEVTKGEHKHTELQ